MFKKAVALLLTSSTIGQALAQETLEAPTDVVATPTDVVETPAAPEAEAAVAVVEEEPLTDMQQKQVDHLMGQIDFDGIENSVKERLTKQILEQELRREIEEHMNQQVSAVVQQYNELEKKWAVIGKEEEANLNKLSTLSVRQMLKAIMENLQTDKAMKELWKNSVPEDRSNLQALNLDFNLETGDVRVHSKATEPDSTEPLFDWNMNANTGEIEEITRKDGKERIVERQVDPETLKVADDFFKIDLPQFDQASLPQVEDLSKATPSAAVSTVAKAASTSLVSTELGKEMPDFENMTEEEKLEWENMEMQRDIAFKIMYFFIAFIIATFGLLYTYFKMSQQVEEDARREEMGSKAYDMDKAGYQKETFFDFLQGNMDNETYAGNPYARHAMQQQMMAKQCEEMPRNQAMNSHRGNEGFGANNLENLMDRNDGESHNPFQAHYRN